jgi:Cof subfamily protein (haloacid dehalogenase superfamily)
VIRLVATDVDGTLLDHHGVLPEGRAAAVRALVAAGIPVVLATGKLWTSVRGLIGSLDLPGPHVACNGSVVFAADGTLLARHLLDPAAADEVTTRLQRDGVPHAVYLEDGTVITDVVRPVHDVLPLLGEPLPVAAGRDGRGVIKVLAILPVEDEGDLRAVSADTASVQRTGPRFLEWNAQGVDKSTGLASVAGLLGIDLADTVAVGDAENDVPMLRRAGVGLAVSGASPAAIAAADHLLDVDLSAVLIALARTGAVMPALAAAGDVADRQVPA